MQENRQFVGQRLGSRVLRGFIIHFTFGSANIIFQWSISLSRHIFVLADLTLCVIEYLITVVIRPPSGDAQCC